MHATLAVAREALAPLLGISTVFSLGRRLQLGLWAGGRGWKETGWEFAELASGSPSCDIVFGGYIHGLHLLVPRVWTKSKIMADKALESLPADVHDLWCWSFSFRLICEVSETICRVVPAAPLA